MTTRLLLVLWLAVLAPEAISLGEASPLPAEVCPRATQQTSIPSYVLEYGICPDLFCYCSSGRGGTCLRMCF